RVDYKNLQILFLWIENPSSVPLSAGGNNQMQTKNRFAKSAEAVFWLSTSHHFSLIYDSFSFSSNSFSKRSFNSGRFNANSMVVSIKPYFSPTSKRRPSNS